jgi:ATP-dependent helicase YprA (DUF1998 family)
MCEGRDLGLSERVRDPHFGLPVLYIFDRYPGGTGLSEGLSEKLGPVLLAAAERLGACPCKEGCPSCVGVDFGEAWQGLPRKGGGIKSLVRDFIGALSGGGQP